MEDLWVFKSSVKVTSLVLNKRQNEKTAEYVAVDKQDLDLCQQCFEEFR
jgi:hypothetical protein